MDFTVPADPPAASGDRMPMAFALTPAANPNNIREDEFGVADGGVIFSMITSCMLMAGITGAGKVFGIHLALINAQGEPFTIDDVQVVADCIREREANPSSVILFGETEFWDADILEALQRITFCEAQNSGTGHFGVRKTGDASVANYAAPSGRERASHARSRAG